MLADVRGKPEQHVLEQLGIRTMAKAIYTTENIGHYGLGFEHYCHFTSPRRRYPDVMVHRILQEILKNKVEVDKKLEAKCKHSSERERAAMESERAANKYKQVEYMQNYLGERDSKGSSAEWHPSVSGWRPSSINARDWSASTACWTTTISGTWKPTISLGRPAAAAVQFCTGATRSRSTGGRRQPGKTISWTMNGC